MARRMSALWLAFFGGRHGALMASGWPPYTTAASAASSSPETNPTDRSRALTNDTLLVLDTTTSMGGTGIHTKQGFRASQCDFQESIGGQPHQSRPMWFR